MSTPGNQCLNMFQSHKIGFILADHGYDVWLCNFRGTTYSKRHVSLNANRHAAVYWNFSYHELGYYDAPAIVDYVLNITNQSKLFYVGHSQGTTIFYVMLALRPEYNNKIHVHISLAPTTYINHIKSPLVYLLIPIIKYLRILCNFFGMYDISKSSLPIIVMPSEFCSLSNISMRYCITFFFLLFGFNEAQLNKTHFPISVHGFPHGSSLKSIEHYLRSYYHGKFCDFECKNVYDITNIRTPIHFFYSLNDYLSSNLDVESFYKQIPSEDKHLHLINDINWNHIDYTFGIDVVNLCYNKMLDILNVYIKQV